MAKKAKVLKASIPIKVVSTNQLALKICRGFNEELKRLPF